MDENLWDRIAEEYDRFVTKGPGSAIRKDVIDWNIDRVLSALPIPSKSLGIDHGSGGGHGANYLLAKTEHAVGFDITRSFLDLAKQNYPELHFYEHDGRVIPLAADLITSKFVLPFVPDLSSEFLWMNKSLKPGGYVVATIFHPDNFHRYDFEEFDSSNPALIRIGEQFPVHMYPRTLETYIGDADKNGLSLVDVTACVSKPGSSLPAKYKEPKFLVCTFQKTSTLASAVIALDSDLQKVYFFRRSNTSSHNPGDWSLPSCTSRDAPGIARRIEEKTGLQILVNQRISSRAGLQSYVSDGIDKVDYVDVDLLAGFVVGGSAQLLRDKYVAFQTVSLDRAPDFCADNPSTGFCMGLFADALSQGSLY